MEFSPTVHGGIKLGDCDQYYIPSNEGPALIHLSHRNAHTWIEKTNRYTEVVPVSETGA